MTFVHAPVSAAAASGHDMHLSTQDAGAFQDAGETSQLPGLERVVSDIRSSAGQVIYLDTDGADDSFSNRPVRIDGSDIPVFQAPGELAGRADSEQIIYLDFDGASQVVYDGPVEVGPFDVASFVFPDSFENRDEVISDLVGGLNSRFDGHAQFVIDRPRQGDFSTVYVGMTDAPFSSYGLFRAWPKRWMWGMRILTTTPWFLRRTWMPIIGALN